MQVFPAKESNRTEKSAGWSVPASTTILRTRRQFYTATDSRHYSFEKQKPLSPRKLSQNSERRMCCNSKEKATRSKCQRLASATSLRPEKCLSIWATKSMSVYLYVRITKT